jgi:hypothetical protein
MNNNQAFEYLGQCKKRYCKNFHPMSRGLCGECFELLCNQVTRMEDELYWSFH